MLEGIPVLVTGAGGFIGSHLVERLVGEGARVRGFLRYTSTGNRGWLEDSPVAEEVEYLRGDITDADFVRKAVKGTEVVFHLAALIGIPYSYEAPTAYVRTNIEGTVNLLQAALQAGSTRFVHTSTSEVYGNARFVPMDESHPVVGQSPYAASKIGADQQATAFHRSFGLPVTTLRPFNTYGPRQSMRAVVPTIALQLLAGEEVRLGSLTPSRDLNYVADTVDGFVRAATAEAAIGRVINLGSGVETTIGDLAAKIAAIVGTPLRVKTDSERIRPAASEVDRLCASNRLADELLGWRPATGLDDGLKLTVDWFAGRVDRYRTGAYAL